MANKLAVCPLRVAFDLDDDFRWLRRPSIASTLGTIVHETTEAAARVRLNDRASRRSQIEELWDQRVIVGRALLEAAWSPAVPPPVTDWPGYEMKRIRTIRRILRSLTHMTDVATVSDHFQWKNSVEERLDDAASGLFGRPDLVEIARDSYRVVDLKTSLDQEEPTEAQRRQLMLYAVLIHRKFQHWPIALEIQDIAGNRRQVQYRPLDAESALREVEDNVAKFNQATTEGRVGSLGHPGPDQCRLCPYRVVCGSYWKTLSSEWDHHSVLGRIIRSRTSEQWTQLTLEVVSPLDLSNEIIQVHGLALEQVSDESSRFASITDLSGSWLRANLHGRWSTLAQLWK